MKVIAQYKGHSYVVPCGTGKHTIDWLIDETIKRANKQSDSNMDIDRDELQAQLYQMHGILTGDDKISEVLDDNAFIYVGSATTVNGHIKFNPSLSVGLENGHSFSSPSKTLELDGNSLETDELVKCGNGEYIIKISDKARIAVQKSRALIESIVEQRKVVYGVNTGFGKFARVVIPNEKLKELQVNLIRSHAVGVGEHLTINRARALLALRINVLAKGYSGISMENLDKMVAVFNSGCVSFVPEKGTVGASGDLAPLAHVALGMIGEGQMWGPNTGWADAATVLSQHRLQAIDLGPKEGLALINGTQLITSIGNEALQRASAISRQADVVAALSLEVLKGTTKAFSKEIHNVRPHKGQKLVASRIRSMLHSDIYRSEIAESHRFCNRVQDAYTLRCTPQVHGIVHDTIEFVQSIISVELNSATDNPMVFADISKTMSGGNFHGEYPAKALDYLAIGIHELANMSERRLERLVNPAYSELPAFLTKEGGLNSGLMMAHCTAASLVSENKVLCHPSSVDSLSTSAGTEDHVSMGGFSARKAITVVEHVEYVLAIELLAACQGIEFLRPLKTTEPLEAVYRLVRSVVKANDFDRFLSPDIEALVKLLQQEMVWKEVKPFMAHYENATVNNDATYNAPSSPTGYSCPPSAESQTSARNRKNTGEPPAKRKR